MANSFSFSLISEIALMVNLLFRNTIPVIAISSGVITARSLNLSAKEVKDRIAELHEENPMLGHRGVRLGLSYPEVYEMQVEAILKAAHLDQSFYIAEDHLDSLSSLKSFIKISKYLFISSFVV